MPRNFKINVSGAGCALEMRLRRSMIISSHLAYCSQIACLYDGNRSEKARRDNSSTARALTEDVLVVLHDNRPPE